MKPAGTWFTYHCIIVSLCSSVYLVHHWLPDLSYSWTVNCASGTDFLLPVCAYMVLSKTKITWPLPTHNNNIAKTSQSNLVLQSLQ